MIAVSGLVVRFGPDAPPAVDGVDLDVAKGETFGLVGESGCGKSSVLRAIAGLIRDHEGEIRIDGERMTARRSKAALRRMQMVFQDPYGSLHPRKTVRSQLLEPLHIQGLDRPNERMAAALDAVKLGRDFRHRFPHQLSGGQRQRVAIARALVLEPSVLLLDEPTSALDVSVQAEILNLLADLRDARGLTYLLVSHDLGVIAHLCSRIAIMQAGVIVERLDVAELRKGAVAHPYSRQLLAASEAYGE